MYFKHIIFVLLTAAFSSETVIANDYCDKNVGVDPNCDYLIGNITRERPKKWAAWMPKAVQTFKIEPKYGVWTSDTEGRPVFIVKDQYACYQADERLSPVVATLPNEKKPILACYALNQ